MSIMQGQRSFNSRRCAITVLLLNLTARFIIVEEKNK
jgi:hypothetical protein